MGRPLQVMLAFKPFIFGGVKGHGQMMDDRHGPALVYCGSEVWSGLRPVGSQSGHYVVSEQAQANWEQFHFSWIIERGHNPQGIIGEPLFRHLWSQDDQTQR